MLIEVQVNVMDGEFCLDDKKAIICQFYNELYGRCLLFNKVSQDNSKCEECRKKCLNSISL